MHAAHAHQGPGGHRTTGTTPHLAPPRSPSLARCLVVTLRCACGGAETGGARRRIHTTSKQPFTAFTTCMWPSHLEEQPSAFAPSQRESSNRPPPSTHYLGHPCSNSPSSVCAQVCSYTSDLLPPPRSSMPGPACAHAIFLPHPTPRPFGFLRACPGCLDTPTHTPPLSSPFWSQACLPPPPTHHSSCVCPGCLSTPRCSS